MHPLMDKEMHLSVIRQTDGQAVGWEKVLGEGMYVNRIQRVRPGPGTHA